MSLFTILPFSSNDNSLVKLDASKVEFFSDAELTAYGHWIFARNPTPLIGLVNNNDLTEQGDPAILSDKHLTISTATGNSLASDLIEIGGATTYCGVIRLKEGTIGTFMMGNGSQGAGGGLIYTSQTSSFLRFKGISTANLGINIPLEEFTFIAVSYTYGPGGTDIKVKIGDNAIVNVNDGSEYTPDPAVPFSLGVNSYSTVGNLMDAAEFMVFEKAMSDVEIEALHQRSIARMAVRGLAIT